MKRMNVVIGLFASAIIVVILGVTPRAAAISAVAGDAVNGQKVFTAQKCEMCHNGKITADLSAIGAKRDAAWLAKYLVAPTVLDPKNPPKVKMAAVKVKGQELDDLVAYLVTLKGKK
jgi:cytochrome c2